MMMLVQAPVRLSALLALVVGSHLSVEPQRVHYAYPENTPQLRAEPRYVLIAWLVR